MKRLAHAKINLGLRILGRRPDGFHEIDTHLVKLELADRLLVRLSTAERPVEGLHLSVEGDDSVPDGPDNLCWRAALAWYDAAGRPPACSIELEKCIPSAAGLGGGSSDAAAVLQCLDAVHGDLLGRRVLHELAEDLGSDVPFFLHAAAAARATGRGTVIHPWPAPHPTPVLLAMPPLRISAADAYAWWSEDASGHRSTDGPATHVNDLEAPVRRRHPIVSEALEALCRAGATVSRLSGSGPCVFGMFESDAAREQARDQLSSDRRFDVWRLIPTRTMGG